MKRAILLLIFCFQVILFSQEKSFTDILFIDNNHGWVTTNYDTLLRTTNGGEKWEKVPFMNSNDIKELFFIDSNTGWAIVDGNVYRTENGGIDWKLFLTGDFSSIFFFNNDIGFLGEYDDIIKTTNAGITWNIVLDSTNNVRRIKFINEEIGFSNDLNYEYRTKNGGNDWEIYFQIILLPDGLIDIFSLNELNWYESIYRAGYVADGYFCSSTNAGIDWDCHYLGLWKYIRKIYFSSSNDGWSIFEDNGGFSLQHTSDRGSRWESKNLPLKDFVFIDSQTAWGYTAKGEIYYTKDSWATSELQFSIITSVDEIYSSAVYNFSLFQNYPNPFNPSTKIKFVIPKSSFVNLKVYDVLGREIVTLVNEEKSAGEYEIEFDATGLPSGVYIYKLQAGSYTSFKKMILLR